MSLALLVVTPVTWGTEFPNVSVLGTPELESNGEPVFAPLTPNMVAVEYPVAVRVTVIVSLDKALVATANHSSRFSFPSLDARTLLENVR